MNEPLGWMVGGWGVVMRLALVSVSLTLAPFMVKRNHLKPPGSQLFPVENRQRLRRDPDDSEDKELSPAKRPICESVATAYY